MINRRHKSKKIKKYAKNRERMRVRTSKREVGLISWYGRGVEREHKQTILMLIYRQRIVFDRRRRTHQQTNKQKKIAFLKAFYLRSFSRSFPLLSQCLIVIFWSNITECIVLAAFFYCLRSRSLFHSACVCDRTQIPSKLNDEFFDKNTDITQRKQITSINTYTLLDVHVYAICISFEIIIFFGKDEEENIEAWHALAEPSFASLRSHNKCARVCTIVYFCTVFKWLR